MTIALILILASALAGMATGFTYKVWALVLISPFIAIFAAIVLHSYEFGLVAGVFIIATCLAVCELTYLAATYLMYRRELLLQDEIDREPGEERQHKICR